MTDRNTAAGIPQISVVGCADVDLVAALGSLPSEDDAGTFQINDGKLRKVTATIRESLPNAAIGSLFSCSLCVA
ncbi:hypothetical protein [Saccharopolyspora sp. NPDC002686]|uniref:hypothetical protein n=1 Tax=Saccharopolyspora sp. NPDC002686 TaxID=3154541 RepID=UPI00332DC69C